MIRTDLDQRQPEVLLSRCQRKPQPTGWSLLSRHWTTSSGSFAASFSLPNDFRENWDFEWVGTDQFWKKQWHFKFHLFTPPSLPHQFLRHLYHSCRLWLWPFLVPALLGQHLDPRSLLPGPLPWQIPGNTQHFRYSLVRTDFWCVSIAWGIQYTTWYTCLIAIVYIHSLNCLDCKSYLSHISLGATRAERLASQLWVACNNTIRCDHSNIFWWSCNKRCPYIGWETRMASNIAHCNAEVRAGFDRQGERSWSFPCWCSQNLGNEKNQN